MISHNNNVFSRVTFCYQFSMRNYAVSTHWIEFFFPSLCFLSQSRLQSRFQPSYRYETRYTLCGNSLRSRIERLKICFLTQNRLLTTSFSYLSQILSPVSTPQNHLISPFWLLICFFELYKKSFPSLSHFSPINNKPFHLLNQKVVIAFTPDTPTEFYGVNKMEFISKVNRCSLMWIQKDPRWKSNRRPPVIE